MRVKRLGVAAVAVVVLTVCLVWGGWRLSKSRSYQLFGDLVTRGETEQKIVALTFDDGPSPQYTDSVLATLARTGARVTFFVVGSGVAAHPEIARRIVEAGHELGNHSYSHRRMVMKTPGFVRGEIERTDSLIRAAGQSGPILFRPPYGKRLVILPWTLSRSGRPTLLWDIEPDSYEEIGRDSARIVEHVMARVRPGSIILLHLETPRRGPARAALPALILALRNSGYELTTASDLLRRSLP